MTLEEYYTNLGKLAEVSSQRALDSIVVPAANELLAKIKNRISQDGKNSANQNIGSYSTKPAYYTKNQFVKQSAFKPIGKNNFKGTRLKSTKEFRVEIKTLKSGKVVERLVSEKNFEEVKVDQKSMYLDQGYKELRQIQGREVSKVNLEYSGDTLLKYQSQDTGNSVLLGFTTEKASNIRIGLETGTRGKKGYGKVFYATDKELEEYNKQVEEASKELTLTILGSV